MARTVEREGALAHGLPYVALGHGPPVVVLRGLSGEHANPAGFERLTELQMVRPLAERFEVYLVGRRPGLAPDATIHDLAADVAGALRAEFDGAVPVEGISTGGSIALQLAIDHPELVRRLVLVAAACRLSESGREAQRRLAELTEAGRPRAAWARLGPVSAASRVGGALMATMMWLAGRSLAPADPSDMLATIRAEDRFDTTDDLPRVGVPTLIVAGGRDRFYAPHLFRETARRIPDATLLVYPQKGHAGVIGHRPAQREIVRFLAADLDESRS